MSQSANDDVMNLAVCLAVCPDGVTNCPFSSIPDGTVMSSMMTVCVMIAKNNCHPITKNQRCMSNHLASRDRIIIQAVSSHFQVATQPVSKTPTTSKQRHGVLECQPMLECQSSVGTPCANLRVILSQLMVFPIFLHLVSTPSQFAIAHRQRPHSFQCSAQNSWWPF